MSHVDTTNGLRHPSSGAPAADRDPPRPDGGARPETSLRQRLRRETRTAHEKLDASFEGLGDARDLRAYSRFLIVNEACHRVLEPVLASSGLHARMPGIEPDRRHEAALADLDALALRPIVLPAFAIPRPDTAEAFGIAYVLEGSRLGARMILKRLRDAAEVDIGARLTTFFLVAAGNGERFRAFLDFADALVPAEADRKRAVEAANSTFEYFLEAVRIADTDPCDGRTI